MFPIAHMQLVVILFTDISIVRSLSLAKNAPLDPVGIREASGVIYHPSGLGVHHQPC